jgi:cell wall-associated NlpC family hydrolase
MINDDSRQAMIDEAMTWLKTPFHHQGRVKGAGVDCAMLLADVYYQCGLIPFIDPRPYPIDWHFHRGEERFLKWVEKYAHEVTVPQKGDIALFKFGRCISHGAIIVQWPMIIHAYYRQGCIIEDVSGNALSKRLICFYSIWND